jgi:hypothetical protein
MTTVRAVFFILESRKNADDAVVMILISRPVWVGVRGVRWTSQKLQRRM